MTRPLVITDCDEVLLHMVRHFRDWLRAEHEIEFALAGNPFAESMRRRGSDEPMSDEDVHRYLNLFFGSQMAVQTPIEGAVEAITELQREADVVILTNLQDRFGESRRNQLQAFGITAPVYTNQGPKGGAVKRIVEELGPRRAVFIDDIAQHHASTADMAPHVGRLHFCGEPELAPHVPCALRGGHAHARIDTWQQALPWLLERLHGE